MIKKTEILTPYAMANELEVITDRLRERIKIQDWDMFIEDIGEVIKDMKVHRRAEKRRLDEEHGK